MDFRDYSLEVLRENRNDLIFIKDNLLIPEDIDRGPTEDMIKISDIIIPPWLRVCEIPTNVEGMSDQRKQFLDLISDCTELIHATYALIKNGNDIHKLTNNAIDINAIKINTDYLMRSYDLLYRAWALIPVNFNMYLIRNLAYVNVLCGYVEPLIMSISEIRDSDPIFSAIASAEDGIDTAFVKLYDFMRKYDDCFVNGKLCADFDNGLSPLAREAIDILNFINGVFIKFSASGSPAYADIQKAILEAMRILIEVVNTDYHFERSKAPLVGFHLNSNIDENDYIPEIPYDYVHQRYVVMQPDNTDDVVDTTPHMIEHSHHMIGDYMV